MKTPLKKRFWKKRSDKAASALLEEAMEHNTNDVILVDELMQSMHERGFGLLLMLFALPNCVPVPVPPGVSSILAIPLLFLAVQMLWGMDYPWLPSWVRKRTIRRTVLAGMVSRAAPRLKKIEKLLRARWSFASTETGEKVIGFFAVIFSLSIFVPLPWTNFIPGIGILLMSLGLMSRDGVVIGLGIVVGIIGVLASLAVIFMGAHVVAGIFG